jgi:glutamine amidotransferase
VIALIDYGAGNLTSVRKAFAAIGAEIAVPQTPAEIDGASAVVIPGVGHYSATRVLDAAWRDAILARVGEGRPLLGICLGMQWLFEGSDEDVDAPGLGLLAGRCFRLSGEAIKVPHVGWNALEMQRESRLTEGVAPGAQVYFTHSFAAPVTSDAVAVTSHGDPFAAIVEHGQVAGVQFHPEKSGDVGLQILRNFRRMVG